MFCSYCGKEIPNGSKFCPYCGNAISVQTASFEGDMPDMTIPDRTPQPSSGIVMDPIYADPGGSSGSNTEADTTPQKKKSHFWIWGAICAFVILGVFWATGNFGSTLSGKYVSETRPDRCSFVFDKNGTLLLYYDGETLYGTYSKVHGVWVLRVEGSGLYFDNVYVAKANGLDSLIISDDDDDPDPEIFVKQW